MAYELVNAGRELLGGVTGGGIQPREFSYGANGTVCVNPDVCFCLDWQQPFGSTIENNASQGCQLFTIALSACILVFYAYEWYKATCGWEEIYVCCVELSKICIELVHEYDTPFCLYLATGSRVLWLRYAEWLMTCPVILIHLSNITGLGTDYNKRTMVLLMSDIGCIVFGATAAFANEGYVKCACFLLGMIWGMNTFYNAAKVYYESYVLVPAGTCKRLVSVMAGLYYISWSLFPILFAVGPEGFGVISLQASTIGHTIADILSKNLWGLMGHFLRVQIYKHILVHGNIRKPIKLHMLGEEVEVMALVSEEGEDTVKISTKELTARKSFMIMREGLKEQGLAVRNSFASSFNDGEVTFNTNADRLRQANTTELLKACAAGDVNRISAIMTTSAPQCMLTGLMTAIAHGHGGAVTSLIEWVGSDVVDHVGSTALLEAARMEHMSVVEALLAAGAQLDEVTPKTVATLADAARRGQISSIRCLLRAGVPAIAKGPTGSTAGHVAASAGKLAALRTLVEYGGLPVSTRDKANNTALDVAEKLGAASATGPSAELQKVVEYLQWCGKYEAAGKHLSELRADAIAKYGPLPDPFRSWDDQLSKGSVDMPKKIHDKLLIKAPSSEMVVLGKVNLAEGVNNSGSMFASPKVAPEPNGRPNASRAMSGNMSNSGNSQFGSPTAVTATRMGSNASAAPWTIAAAEANPRKDATIDDLEAFVNENDK